MRKIFKSVAVVSVLASIMIVAMGTVAIAAGPNSNSADCPNSDCPGTCSGGDCICDGDQIRIQDRMAYVMVIDPEQEPEWHAKSQWHHVPIPGSFLSGRLVESLNSG